MAREVVHDAMGRAAVNRAASWWQAVTAGGRLVQSPEGRWKFCSPECAHFEGSQTGESYTVSHATQHSAPHLHTIDHGAKPE